jgi:glycosyltransferase involved in cell wall biosynthesis
MKIIHLVCVAPPEIGGMGQAAAEEVAGLVRRGIDATLVSLTTHAGFRLGNAGALHGLEFLVKEADIVHLHYPFYGTQGSVARLRRNRAIKKLVITLHMDATAPGPRGWYFGAQRKLFQSRILNAADALIVSSKDYAQHSSFAPYAEKAQELPFGVAEQKFCPAAQTVDRAVPVLLFVGGMDRAHAFKGVEVLLRALRQVLNAWLVLVGEGDLRKSYERLAEKLGVAGRCKFKGRVAPDDLVTAYQSADILVLPSTSGAEAFGLVALEAQACGVPVVASDLPGVRTVVAHEQTGLLVQPRDEQALSQALTRLCTDPILRRRMGECARARVLERFTWEKHLDGLMAVYNNLVG